MIPPPNTPSHNSNQRSVADLDSIQHPKVSPIEKLGLYSNLQQHSSHNGKRQSLPRRKMTLLGDGVTNVNIEVSKPPCKDFYRRQLVVSEWETNKVLMKQAG
ncbi:hypothetical protein RRG08_024508 [Elysia crispata]|uniref:Uncharacterized protein n=1 Tax=Elysia crispata TaxID=231223 RepID=A0AAE0YPR4_9GAST|nr:hypothetical protein RRG08_024508 [Elysia crispata]